MAEVAAHITDHVLPHLPPSANGCWAFRSGCWPLDRVLL